MGLKNFWNLIGNLSLYHTASIEESNFASVQRHTTELVDKNGFQTNLGSCIFSKQTEIILVNFSNF